MRSVFALVAVLAIVAACSPDDAKTSGPIGFGGTPAGVAGVGGRAVTPPVVNQPNQPGVTTGGVGASGPGQPGGDLTPAGAAGSTPIGPAKPPATAAGTGATGGTVAAAGSGMPIGGAPGPSGGPAMTSKDPKIPPINGDCPPFKEGTTTMDFMGLKGVIFEVGAKKEGTGTLIFYWHGTGSFAGEYASSTVPGAVLSDLKAKGGILVSPQSGTGTGGDCSGTRTFSKDDFKVADQIAACAVKNWNIDPHRIWATGCSAGGLQSGCMAKMRSSYMAGAVPNSGGEVFPTAAEDKSHIGSMMTIHGAPGKDVVGVDFSDTSKTINDSVKAAGGFAVDCNHGGGHCGLPLLPTEVAKAGWEFMQAHPFGVSPEPYAAGLPASFPKYCKIW
jgi:hypothetical protein